MHNKQKYEINAAMRFNSDASMGKFIYCLHHLSNSIIAIDWWENASKRFA